MFFSLVKSISFHGFVVFVIFFVTNFLSFTKKKDIIEIPIEVVEIDEKTRSKKEIVKKKVKETVEKKFSIPDPISKPKIPEFVAKQEKKIVKKKELVKEVKQVEKKNRLNSILKSIDKVKSETKVDNVEEDEKKNKNQELELDTKLTISELDMIRRQFISCWNVPSGAKNIENLQVTVKISLDEDGNVTNAELVKTKSFKNSFYRAAAESAMRAVRHPSCKKLKVPVKKYNVWKNITLNFDPSMMLK